MAKYKTLNGEAMLPLHIFGKKNATLKTDKSKIGKIFPGFAKEEDAISQPDFSGIENERLKTENESLKIKLEKLGSGAKKELKARIEELETENESLKAEIEELKQGAEDDPSSGE